MDTFSEWKWLFALRLTAVVSHISCGCTDLALLEAFRRMKYLLLSRGWRAWTFGPGNFICADFEEEERSKCIAIRRMSLLRKNSGSLNEAKYIPA
jgi:hypothetical protein